MLAKKKGLTKPRKTLLCLIPILLILLHIFDEIQVQGADVTEYLNLITVEGVAEISDADRDASWTSTDNGVATFENGRIYGHDEGVATVKIKTQSGIKSVNVSVYMPYPQPKSAHVFNRPNGVQLHRWAKSDDNALTGTIVHTNDLVEVLWRVLDQQTGELMQFVRTESRKTGYISVSDISDRPSGSYHISVNVGETAYLNTYNSQGAYEDSNWTSDNANIAAISNVTHNGFKNQGKVEGKKEGFTPVTATAERVKNSNYVSVCTPVGRVNGVVERDTLVRVGAEKICRAARWEKQGTAVTIVGRSGDYWRIGTNQFILMTDVDIPATDITLNHTNVILYTSGDASSVQLQAKISPVFDGQTLPDGKVEWSSSSNSVIQVSDSGLISAKSGGKAVVTASIDGRTEECTVTVCVPAVKVTMPLVQVLAVKKSTSLKPVYAPLNVWGNTVTWTSSDTKTAKTDNKGKVAALSKEGNSFIQAVSTPMTPTVGTKAKPQAGRTLVSVYTPKSVNVMTKYDNRPVFQGATTAKGYSAGKIKAKGTLLRVLGSSKNYYYVRYMSDTGKRAFIRKSDVVQVTLVHKTVNPKQTYSLKLNDIPLLRATKNTDVKAAVRKGKNVTLNRVKKAYDGTVTTKGEGVSWIQINRIPAKNRNNPKIYIVHMTVAKRIPLKTGYISKSVNACLCWGNSCVTRILPAGTKIKILGQSGSYFRVSYLVSGKEEIRYIAKSAAAYIDFAPVILGQGKTKVQGITYHGGLSQKETVVKSVAVAPTKGVNRIAAAKIQSGRISINTSKSKTGYRVLKITAQVKTGRYAGTYTSYAPLTVYERVKKRNAYIRVQTDFKNGASAGSSQCTSYGKLNKNRKVILMGRAGNYYFIDTGNKSVGYHGYGFVKKRDLVYLELSRSDVTIKKNIRNLPTITVKIHNASGSGWSSTKGILTYQELKNRRKTITNRGIEHVTTRVYQLNPSKEGAADTIFSCGVLRERCYVSSYTPIVDVLGRSGVPGYINTKTVSRRIAGSLTRFSTYGTVSKNTGVQLYGKCGSWFRVRYNNKSVWVARSTVTYMMLTRLQNSMYQHHAQTIKADVYNQKGRNGISYLSSNSRTVGMSKNGKLNAHYSGRVTVSARHTYANGKYLQASATVNIKPIWITLKPSTRVVTKDSIKTVNGRRSMVVAFHSVVNLQGTVFTLPEGKIRWSLSNRKRVAGIKKNGNMLVITGSSQGNGSLKVTAQYKNVKKTITIKFQGSTQTITLPNPPTTSGGGGQKDNPMLDTYFKQNPHLSEREKDIIRSMANLNAGSGGRSKGPIEKALSWIVDTFVSSILSYPVEVTVNLLNFTGDLVEGVGALLAYIAGGGKSESLYNQAMKALERLPSSASAVAWNAIEMLLSIGIAKLGTAAFSKMVKGLKKKFPKLSKKIDDFVHSLKRKMTTKKTKPTIAKGSKPKGEYAKGNSYGIKKENQTADTLAKNGYDVTMLPELQNGNGNGIKKLSNPDYSINGNVFDCYSPQESTSIRTICNKIADKSKTQAERIILNADGMSEQKLKELAENILRKANSKNGDLRRLKELLIVKDGKIIRLI